MKEIEFLKKLDHHQNIVRYFHAEEANENDCIYIALELCPTNLYKWVTGEKTVEIPEMEILSQSTCGIAFLHECKVIHQDLKPQNLLISSQAQIKISDFGISKQIPEGLSSTSIHTSEFGTEEWMSPEVLSNVLENTSNKLTAATDIFSLGCIFYFVLTKGEHPFGNIVRRQVNILDDNPINLTSMLALNSPQPNILLQIKAMLSHNVDQRPSAKSVLNALQSLQKIEHVTKEKMEEIYHKTMDAKVQNSEELYLELNQSRAELENRQKIPADLVKFYHDQMQKHCENLSYIRPDQLGIFHEKSCRVILESLEKHKSLKISQITLLEMDMMGLYEQYQERNVMNLNFVNDVAPAIGIDLGTIYSCVAVYYNGNVRIVPIKEQDKSETTASFVTYNATGTKTIGNQTDAYKHPESTIYDVKRVIGRKMNDPEMQRYKEIWPVTMVGASHPTFAIRERRISPKEVCAELFSSLRKMAANHLGLKPKQVTKAVITVPAHFNDILCEAIKKAGELAGLEVLALLHEPVSVAMAYSLERLENGSRKVLTIDMGGGTFDAALLDVSPSKIEMLCVDVDTHLNGRTLDLLLTEYCTENILRKSGIELMNAKSWTERYISYYSHQDLISLQDDCENSKIHLSNRPTTTVYNKLVEMKIDRQTFENLSMHLFQRMIDILNGMLVRTGIQKEDVNDVVLVGGCTHIPKVQEMLKTYFGGKSLTNHISPDAVVAHGAAVLAAKLNGEQVAKHIKDVLPISLRIETGNETILVIIPKNAKLPTKTEVQLNTAKDGQTSIIILVYRGEERSSIDNTLLGQLKLDGIPPGPRGKEIVDVTLEVDLFGVIYIEAKNRGNTRAKKKKTIDWNSGKLQKQIATVCSQT